MGSYASAYVMWGCFVDREAWEWKQPKHAPDFVALWERSGLAAGDLEEPSDDAGYGCATDHFFYQVAEALGLASHDCHSYGSGRCVIGLVFASDGRSRFDPTKWRIGARKHAAVERVAKALRLPKPRWHVVARYG